MAAWILGPATAALDRCLLTFGTSLDELDLDSARVVLSSYRTTTSSDGDGALLLIHLDGDRTLRLIKTALGDVHQAWLGDEEPERPVVGQQELALRAEARRAWQFALDVLDAWGAHAPCTCTRDSDCASCAARRRLGRDAARASMNFEQSLEPPHAEEPQGALAVAEERRDLLDSYLREVWKTATNGFMAPELQAERLSDLALEIAHALGEENWPKGQR